VSRTAGLVEGRRPVEPGVAVGPEDRPEIPGRTRRRTCAATGGLCSAS